MQLLLKYYVLTKIISLYNFIIYYKKFYVYGQLKASNHQRKGFLKTNC